MDPAELMALALREAARARGRTRPNPLVGCVVAKEGRVIAVGHHRRAGLAHAEVVALGRAGADARGADVFVNLEPCDHHGRTAPCTEALIAAGVARVWVGTRDPNPLVDGKGLRRLRAAGIDVRVGLLGDQARRLNEAFEHAMRTGRPFVVAKLAESLDGRVATRAGDSQWITSEAARKAGRKLRAELDAIAVGVGTVRADDPLLTARQRGAPDPVRIILDTHARTPPKARVLTGSAPTWIAASRDAPARRLRALERAGAEILACKTRRGRIDLHDLLEQLGARQIRSLLVEGGPTVLGGFCDAALIDKVHAFVAPLLIGGEDALGAIGGRGPGRLADALRLSIDSLERVGDDLHVIAYPGPAPAPAPTGRAR